MTKKIKLRTSNLNLKSTAILSVTFIFYEKCISMACQWKKTPNNLYATITTDFLFNVYKYGLQLQRTQM
jgi:hypothetical protein